MATPTVTDTAHRIQHIGKTMSVNHTHTLVHIGSNNNPNEWRTQMVKNMRTDMSTDVESFKLH